MTPEPQPVPARALMVPPRPAGRAAGPVRGDRRPAGGLGGFALLRTIPLSPAEWRRTTGSPFPRRD